MTDATAFIAAICAEPADDTPRLVYADWLEEHDQPERAEFIRVQVELAIPSRHKRACCQCKGCFPHAPAAHTHPCEWAGALRRRERELWKNSGDKGWWDAIPGSYRSTLSRDTQISNGEGMIYVMRRGFVSHIICTAASWIAHADALVWRPGAMTIWQPGEKTPACERCIGKFTEASRSPVWSRKCPVCRGSRGVPRPCPPTAQPITKVTLTAYVRGTDEISPGERATGIDTVANTRTFTRWPGIEFELPANVQYPTQVVRAAIGRYTSQPVQAGPGRAAPAE